MTRRFPRVGARWAVLRARNPRAAARVEDALLAARGYRRLVDDLRRLRVRLHELERDHLLLAAHVAILTERAAAGPADPDGEAARQRARLAAIAHYEERIGRLEDLAARRHARPGRGAVTIGRTSGEPRGAVR